MKKLKEKIFDNEKVQFIKELWANKKTRSLVWLGLYLIFFIFLGVIMRSTTTEDGSVTPSESDIFSVENVFSNLENTSRENYNYTLLVGEEELVGSVLNGTNSFIYQGNHYIFVYTNLYLQTEENLELVDNFLNSAIPIRYLTLDYILDALNEKDYKTKNVTETEFSVKYNLSTSEFMNDSMDRTIEIVLMGENNVVDKIKINYQEGYILELIEE